MKVPFTWKVTGWFMVGWSAEFPAGEVRPLRYFGEDLVAYRDEAGELHVLSGHCRHLGAHIGHGGKVVGDCVECPFHGWRWGPDGTNRYIPYQPDRPNKALRLRVYPVREQYGCVFVWHQPDGKEPQWEMPDLFHKFPQFPTDPDAYYRPYPEFSRRTEHEPVHPQIVAENGPDSAHFHYVHGATVTPVCLNWEAVDEEWRFLTGWPDARSDDPDKMALYIHSHFSGLGFAISAFEGSSNHRLIFACTPVEDGYSDMFYSIWWPRLPGDTSDVPPDSVREQVERQFLGTVWEDLDIWRYQEYVEHPALSKVDAKPYMAMRKWATQFYEVPATPPGGPGIGMSVDLAEIAAPGHTAIVTQELRAPSSDPTPAWPCSPRRRAARRCPTSNACCPPRATPACASCTASCSGDPTASARTTTPDLRDGQERRSTSVPAARARRCCPNSALPQTMSCCSRWHGVGPMGGTDLDAILRNLGVTTIVAVGVSVNIAITNLVMDAVNAGLPRRRPA